MMAKKEALIRASACTSVNGLYTIFWMNYMSEIRFISKVTLSSPCPWACFRPPIPSFSGIRKVRKFYYISSISCRRYMKDLL